MIWLDRTISFALIAFSILVLLSSITLELGDFQNPGPGFMPFLVSILLFSLSVAVLLMGRKWRDEHQRGMGSINWKDFKKPIGWIIILFGYVFLLDILGYLFNTFLLLFLMFFSFQPKKWFIHIVVAAGMASLSFFVFHEWLQVPLPIGVLRFIM